MKLEIAKAIVEAGEACGFEMSVYEDYSGRGMYGEKTTGVMYQDTNDLIVATATVVQDKAQDIAQDDEGEDGDPEAFLLEVRRFRYDNMGRTEMIVY